MRKDADRPPAAAPRQRELFNDSYERMLGARVPAAQREAFLSDFYDRFIASSVEVREKFRKTDMARQRRMLQQSIAYLLNYYATGRVTDVLRKIADRHGQRDLDIPPRLYDLWLNALLDTLRVYDPKWCAEVESAWREVLAVGIAYMRSIYNESAAG